MKKFFALILTILLLTSSLGMSSIDTTNNPLPPPEVLAQEKAVNASIDFMNTLEMDEHGRYVYPDYFGGIYIEDNELFISVTDITPMNSSMYKSLFEKYSDVVNINIVENSYNELYQQAKDVAEQLIADGISVTSYSVNEIKNNSKIGVLNTDVASAEYILNSEQMYSSIGSEIEIVGDSLVTPELTIYGAKPVRSSETTSIAICGTYNGQNALITSGHGHTPNVSTRYGTTSSSTIIGTVERAIYYHGATGDYSISSINQNHTPTNDIYTSSNTTIAITATASSPVVGTRLNKSGKESYSAYLEIVERDKTITSRVDDDTTYTLHGMTACKLLTGATAPGDSGGPYYLYTNGRYAFCGVHSGSNTETSTTYTYFTPYSIINNAGFYALTE